MTQQKRKLFYALVILLFLFVITLIGWLAHVLFALRVVPPSTAPAPVAAVKPQQAGEGPFSETVINVDAPSDLVTGKTGQDDEASDETIITVPAGHIPFVCEGYGPSIRGREAFPNPLTHETVVSATRAVVTLTLPPSPPRGDQ